MSFFDRYFHIPVPIVTKHELGLPFPPRNIPKNWYKSVHNRFSYRGHRQTHTHTHTHTDKPTPVKTYSLAFVRSLEKAGTHKSAPTHAGTVFVTRDFDLSDLSAGSLDSTLV